MSTVDNVLGAIVSTSVFLLLSAMLISYLSNDFDRKKMQTHQIITLLSFAFFSLFAVHSAINAFISIISSSNGTFNPEWCASGLLQMSSFTFGKLFAYHFFLYRLYQVFDSTPFAVRVWKLKMMAVIVAFPIIVSAGLGYYRGISTHYAIRNHADRDTVQQINDFAACTEYDRSLRSSGMSIVMNIGIALYLLTELLYSVFILRSFVGKILLLSMPAWNKQSSGAHSAAFSHDLLDVAMRTTNLIILLVSSGVILLIKSGARLHIYWLTLEALITCLSVYLSLKCSTKYYNALFAPCHKWFHKPCIRCCFCCCLKHKLPKDLQLPSYQKNGDAQTQTATIGGIGIIDVASSQSDLGNSEKSIDSHNELVIV